MEAALSDELNDSIRREATWRRNRCWSSGFSLWDTHSTAGWSLNSNRPAAAHEKSKLPQNDKLSCRQPIG
jgi:hypothetical protein